MAQALTMLLRRARIPQALFGMVLANKPLIKLLIVMLVRKILLFMTLYTRQK